MGNHNSTTGCGASAYSRLPSSHYSSDDDHSLRDPLLRNITQRMEEQHQQLLHHIYEATRVKETVKSATTSSSSPNPPPSKPMEQKPNGHHALEKELHQELIRHGVAKPKALASWPSCYKQGEAIERLKEKNATLEKRVMELTATIEEMKRTGDSYINNNNNNIKIPAAGSGSTPHRSISDTPISDLITRCLVVLIFLVAVLIGVLL